MKKKNRIGVWFSCIFSGLLAIGTYIVTNGAGEKSCCQWCRFSYLWCYCLRCNLVTKGKSSCQWCTLAFGAVTPRLIWQRRLWSDWAFAGRTVILLVLLCCGSNRFQWKCEYACFLSNFSWTGPRGHNSFLPALGWSSSLKGRGLSILLKQEAGVSLNLFQLKGVLQFYNTIFAWNNVRIPKNLHIFSFFHSLTWLARCLWWNIPSFCFCHL